jgi:hypothetical protein
MRQAARLIAVVTILTSGIIPYTVVASQAQDSETKKAVPKKKPEGASLTGCVDEQDGKYVLVDDHDLKVVANLEAEGFPTEGFAKHVGQKVTVRGTNNPSGARPVFKVRSIETISETCASQATQRKDK